MKCVIVANLHCLHEQLTAGKLPNVSAKPGTAKNPFFLKDKDEDDYKLQAVYVVFWPEVWIVIAEHICWC